VTRPTHTVRDLPHALHDNGLLARRLAGRRLAVFLDYDGVLTPIVDRPDEAVMSDSMRAAVRALAARCPVSVVSGRDRAVLQSLMGIDDLVVAGSHGFDIWSPVHGDITHEGISDFSNLIAKVTERLRAEVGSIPGVEVEPKHASVAVHYRRTAPEDRERVAAAVRVLLADYPDQLKVTPGKMVYELQPKIDWDKGKAVLHLMDVLGLTADDVVPMYVGDDITDEDAFRALGGRGVGIIVGHPDDPEVADRTTAADFSLASTEEVEQFLNRLAC
jgi:trehalose 6-phosphate phosphatase